MQAFIFRVSGNSVEKAEWGCLLAAVEQVKRQGDEQVLRTVELKSACAVIVAMQSFISFLNLLVCFSLFKLVMMGRLRLTDWAVLPWLIEYIIWMKI